MFYEDERRRNSRKQKILRMQPKIDGFHKTKDTLRDCIEFSLKDSIPNDKIAIQLFATRPQINCVQLTEPIPDKLRPNRTKGNQLSLN